MIMRTTINSVRINRRAWYGQGVRNRIFVVLRVLVSIVAVMALTLSCGDLGSGRPEISESV